MNKFFLAFALLFTACTDSEDPAGLTTKFRASFLVGAVACQAEQDLFFCAYQFAVSWCPEANAPGTHCTQPIDDPDLLDYCLANTGIFEVPDGCEELAR